MDRYLSDTEVAYRLGIHRVSVWKLASRGVLPAPIHIGRAARWKLSELVVAEEGLAAARTCEAAA